MSAVKKPEHAELNEHAQKNAFDKPEYHFVDRMVGSRKEFTANCKYTGKVTKGSAFNKNEAKRISAEKMLALLSVKDSSMAPKKAPAEPVIQTNKLETFDSKRLDVHLDKYLETRDKDASKFRQLFVGGMSAENVVDESELCNDGNSSKSETLDKLTKAGIAVNATHACRIFKAIVQEMKLNYFAEFIETAKNDRYAVVIKLSINLFTAGGIGNTPEKAIQECCKNAIEFFYLFNL